MTRPVRLASAVEDDINSQLDEEVGDLFWRFDRPAALTLLARPAVWESLPLHGGG